MSRARRALALLIVLALVFSAALVVTSPVLGPHVERWVGSPLNAERMTAWVWWTVVAALTFAFGLVLYLAPDVRRQSWRHVLPGAAVAMVIWLVGSGGFAV